MWYAHDIATDFNDTNSTVRGIACRVADFQRLTLLEEVLLFPATAPIGHHPERKVVALTRAKYKVIASTKCEVNITMKYNTASAAIVSMRF